MKRFMLLLAIASAVCGMMSDVRAEDFGVLQLTTEPSEVTVYVDGTKKGTSTPISLKLKEGDHTITIERSGYSTKKFDIFVGADTVSKREVKLDKEGTFTNSIGMTFVKIPAGTFMMGSPSSEPQRSSYETQHKVTISKSFYMQTTEVTQGQWRAIMSNNPSKFKDCGDNCPVESVSWNDTQAFIKKLNEKEGTGKYRLPTEAEWEYAARAGSTTAFNWGDKPDCSKFRYEGSEKKCFEYMKEKRLIEPSTVPVMSYPPNVWGLYDIHDSVSEWCQDLYGEYPFSEVTDPYGSSTGLERVLRGGGWFGIIYDGRSASRHSYLPSSRSELGGFRLVHSE